MVFIVLKSFAAFYLLFIGNLGIAAAGNVDVEFLTHAGPRVLKSWTPDEIRKFAHGKSQFSAQKFLFDVTAESLPLNDRASIDLVTVVTDSKTIRVPRFLIWREIFQFKWNHKTGELSSLVKHFDPARLLVPASYFEVGRIRKIEFSARSTIHPHVKLKLRTNPAASRGEKLFAQSCLACHQLDPASLTKDKLKAFDSIHAKHFDRKLDARSERGLAAYLEALALERNEVKPGK